MRAYGWTIAALLLSTALPLAVHAEGASSRYLVGYEPGSEDEARLAIQAAGGKVQRTSPDLHFAVVTTDRAAFADLVSTSPFVTYVERDDATRLDGAQWNGAQWNGAQWNGAQWNGAQWNGAQWNGAQWNDADLKHVSEAQRLASKWTERHFDVSSDVKMQFAGDATDPGFVWQWGAWATRGPDAWTSVTRGTGAATLCVLDSGVDASHGDVAPNFLAAYNAIDPLASPADDGGHGTHVAGVAAGALANGYGVGGAGNARILSAKVLDGNGGGYEGDLAFGLAWCANMGAKVAVMALSVTEADHPTLERALAYAAQRDVLLLASAGNTGGKVQYPASHPAVMAVSAVDGNLALASFSSRGPQVDLAAPGVHVLGPLPGGQFAFGSGTSQAVAYAAGVAALVRDHKPAYSAQQAWSALAAGAKDLGPAGRDDATGHGLVMVDGALRA